VRQFDLGYPIDNAMRRAAREALLQHKREGRPAVIWRDGKVVWIQPEDIVVPDEPAA
jgi:hypothetical protein